jgi:hypothetical protein
MKNTIKNLLTWPIRKIKNFTARFRTHIIYLLIIANMVIYAHAYLTGSQWYNEYINLSISRAEAKTIITEEGIVSSPIPSVGSQVYAYNERVPAEEVKAEIERQAKEFGLSAKTMTDLALCESELDNLATNNTSSATGVYQYIWGTWKTTDSWKLNHYARTDYKMNIREAMIDMANREHHHWVDCLKKIGFN